MASVSQNPTLEQTQGQTYSAERLTIAPRLLRTNQAARYLGLGSKAIRQLIFSGQLPYVQMKPGNSPFLLDRRDLDRFIEMHKTPAVGR
jgi:excisionase family DNA binding protein